MTLYRSRGAVVLALAFTISSARADLAPISQDRSIRSTVSGSYIDAQGTSYPPPTDQTQAAGDFSPFNAAVSSGFGVPMGQVGSDVSSANQNSQIGPRIVIAGADAAATAARFHSDTTLLQYNYTATAGSTFSYVFTVGQATPVMLSGTIHTDTTEDFAENASVTVSLNSSSGVIAYFASPSVITSPVPPQYDAPIAFTGTLLPGRYSLFATASASPFFVPGVDAERQHASFQIKLEQLPEPACPPLAALVLIGAVTMRRRPGSLHPRQLTRNPGGRPSHEGSKRSMVTWPSADSICSATACPFSSSASTT